MTMWKFAAATVLLWALARGAGAESGPNMTEFRLPADTKPESYDLKFVPNFNGTASTFRGEVNITISVLITTSVVTLNLKDLTVTNVSLTDIKTSREVPVAEVAYSAVNEQLKIHLKRSVFAKRTYAVWIAYEGKIRNDLTGLYMSSYAEGNATKWLAVTQFEPVYARRAFPCYDEPAYKATFEISVVKQKNQIALSNMPIAAVVHINNDTDLVLFNVTLPMSAYLAAIYVGEFVPNKNDTDLTIYTHSQYVSQTKYVEDAAPKLLEVLSNYTDIRYMLPKMDLLAIPDFSAGAMENWGINTYRESYLLLHEESKAKMKIRASEVVQHEFTHQWFGNLVTCEWWDYLWLNEGFARYFQYFAAGIARPSWPVEEQFLVEAFHGALEYDQKPRHAITSSVNTPEEIEGIFDTISYSKAASVLRMLKHVVTEKVFNLAIRSYLDESREGTATPEDLFTAFDNELVEADSYMENGLSVNDFMLNWTLTPGYPVLDISKNETENTFSVTQSRFLTKKGDDNSTGLWIVGLTYTTESNKTFTNTKPSKWTDSTSKLTKISAPPKSGWYIFNIQSTGFYRVNYEYSNWMALIKQLNESATDVHVLNRAQLLSDSFNLARAGQLNYTVPLRMTKYLKKEDSTTPWYPAKNGLTYLLERMSRNEKGYANLRAYVSKLAGTIYKKLQTSVSNNNSEFSVLSAWDDFSKWACSLGDEYCTKKALEYYGQWVSGKRIPADIKDAAFCAGVKNSSDSSAFEKIFHLYTTTTSISEKTSVLSALGCSTNKTLLNEYINHILDGPRGPIKEKDYESVISSISATPLGVDVLLEFLSANLNKTLNEVSDGRGVAKHLYSTLASKLTNSTHIEKIKSLLNDTSLPACVRKSFEKSYTQVDDHLSWFNVYSDEIGQWALENQEPEEPEESVTTTTIQPPATKTNPTSSPGYGVSSTTAKPSSSASNVQNSFMVVQLTACAYLIKIFMF